MANVEVKDSGNLQEKGALTHFLSGLATNFKGVMVFGRGKEKKSFILEEGQPLISTASLAENILGKVLFDKNLINAEQFNKVKQIEAAGKSFFQAVIECDENLKATVQNLLLDIWTEDLATIFMWESGQFASVEFLPKDVTKLEMPKSIYQYIFQALKRKNMKVKNKFAPTMRYEVITPETSTVTLDHLALNEIETKIYNGFKEAKRIRDIASATGAKDVEVIGVILSLREMGFARADSDSKKKPMAATTVDAQVSTSGPEEFTKLDENFFHNKLKQLDTLDYFELLEVKRTVSQQDLQKVYFALAKKFHPDRLKTKANIPTKDAERFFGRMTEAYNTLSNATLRKEYEFKTSKETSAHEALMRKIVESESVYIEGRNFLNKNMFLEAIEKIQAAIALYDQEPEYFVKLGWALFRQGVKESSQARIAEGKKLLVNAYNQEYLLAEVSYDLGMISKHENKLADAARYFRRCISVESTHSLAMSELRMIEKKLDEKSGKKK